MPNPLYPFDETGRSPDSRVVNEYHTLTQVNDYPFRIIIPEFAPFYTIDFEIDHIAINGDVTPLNEGVDWNFAIPFMGATRGTGKPVYGGIPIINTFTNGAIRISYQTVGGSWCADRGYIYERLLEIAYNPRTTWWDQISNVQEIFPVIDHDHSTDDVQQVMALFPLLAGIQQAILEAPNNVPASYIQHMQARNPHGLTLQDLGGKSAATLEKASDQEVANRTMVDKTVTLRQVLMLLQP